MLVGSKASRHFLWAERCHDGVPEQVLPEAVLAEVIAVSTSQPGSEVAFVDNIMDHRYYTSLLPHLAELDLPVSLFYEIKSNVTRDRVERLRAAGVT